jgi:hypothetical protein
VVLNPADKPADGEDGRSEEYPAGDEGLSSHAGYAFLLRRILHRLFLRLLALLLRRRHLPRETTEGTLRIGLQLHRRTVHQGGDRGGYGQFSGWAVRVRYDLHRIHGPALRQHRRGCTDRQLRLAAWVAVVDVEGQNREVFRVRDRP